MYQTITYQCTQSRRAHGRFTRTSQVFPHGRTCNEEITIGCFSTLYSTLYTAHYTSVH